MLNTVLCLHIGALLSIFFIICFDVQLNVRSLNIADKFEEVATIIQDKKFDISGLTETWINNSIPSESCSIPGYCLLIRLDGAMEDKPEVLLFMFLIHLRQRED